MRKLFLLLTLLLCFDAYCQDNGKSILTISGKIIDKNSKEPIEYATVVFKSIDSGIVKYGGISNHKGDFSIEVEKGFYDVSIEFISYKTKKLNLPNFQSNLDLGTISMELNLEALNEIEILSVKKQVEIKPNKKIINVSKDIASSGGMTTDILNNIPSISVDPTGIIKLNGMENPTLLINGKVSMLTKADALKSLPANSIERIEVISHAGAKYKASSTGIINIILKKGENTGFNSSITASGGFKDYYGGLVNLNYKTEHINIYFNPSYYHKNIIKIANTETTYFNNNSPSSFLEEEAEFNSKNGGFISNLGIDFYLSKKATLSAAFNYSNIHNISTTDTYSNIYDSTEILNSSNLRILDGDFNDEILEGNLSFEQQFKNEDQVFAAFLNYSRDTETYMNDVSNSNQDFTDIMYTEKNVIENYIADLSYSTPLSDYSIFSFGYYGEFGKIPFSIATETLLEEISYFEDINSLYLDYKHYFDNFYLNVGLRGEFSKINLEYLNSTKNSTKNYNNLFPSIDFEYNFKDNQNISISYSRNISRPGYYQLQPFQQRYTETLSYKGNEQLTPINVHMAHLSYLFNSKVLNITPGIYYNKYDNYWQNVTLQTGESIDGARKLLTTIVNLGYVNYYGADLTLTIKATKWLEFMGYINVFNFDQHGSYEYTPLNTQESIILDFNQANVSGSQSLLMKLKFPKILNFQVNVKHEMKSVSSYSTREAFTYASMAISKDFLKNNASLSLICNDVFNSYNTDRNRFDVGFDSNSFIKDKYQTVILSFTYRFNQSKKDQKIEYDKKDINPEF